jgi:hypothetical protein
MSTSSAPSKASTAAPVPFIVRVRERVQPYLTPYYIVVGAVLGGITVGFVALTLVIVLIATNFNVLGLIE